MRGFKFCVAGTQISHEVWVADSAWFEGKDAREGVLRLENFFQDVNRPPNASSRELQYSQTRSATFRLSLGEDVTLTTSK
jgi:hypothetical protein